MIPWKVRSWHRRFTPKIGLGQFVNIREVQGQRPFVLFEGTRNKCGSKFPLSENIQMQATVNQHPPVHHEG
jgi:hypothetical protein